MESGCEWKARYDEEIILRLTFGVFSTMFRLASEAAAMLSLTWLRTFFTFAIPIPASLAMREMYSESLWQTEG